MSFMPGLSPTLSSARFTAVQYLFISIAARRLDIKNQSWVQDTENQVAFLIRTLQLKGDERILDLACGFGRHALALADRGFEVVGVDITQAYIDDAAEKALPARFMHSDIRDLDFDGEFDVVLNLADGAIGYLEDDAENLKIFDVAARALKPDGKHFIEVCNADHAEAFFPKRHWDVGDQELSLAEFEWDAINQRMIFGGWQIPYGEIAQRSEILEGDPTRLYSVSELERIYADCRYLQRLAWQAFESQGTATHGVCAEGVIPIRC